MACFGDINVSQGRLATYARCDGMFNMHITANLLRNLPVKKIEQQEKNYLQTARRRIGGER